MSFGALAVYAQPTSGGNPPTSGGTPPTSGGNPQVSPVKVGFSIENPFKVKGNLYQLIEQIIENIILPIGAVLCVLAFIYSGFLYVTAQGNTTQIAKANNALLNSAIGTAVLLGSWTIARMIQGTVNQLR